MPRVRKELLLNGRLYYGIYDRDRGVCFLSTCGVRDCMERVVELEKARDPSRRIEFVRPAKKQDLAPEVLSNVRLVDGYKAFKDMQDRLVLGIDMYDEATSLTQRIAAAPAEMRLVCRGTCYCTRDQTFPCVYCGTRACSEHAEDRIQVCTHGCSTCGCVTDKVCPKHPEDGKGMFAGFKEHNDWEGETWMFFERCRDTADAQQKMTALAQAVDEMEENSISVLNKPHTLEWISEYEGTETGYMPAVNFVPMGTFEKLTEAVRKYHCPFYKGEIREDDRRKDAADSEPPTDGEADAGSDGT